MAILLLLSLGLVPFFHLKFFKSPSEDATNVFTAILAISLLALFYMENNDPALPYTENFSLPKAGIIIIAGFIAILGVAKEATTILGSTSLSWLSFWQPLATTTSLSGADFVAWNLLVALTEESFKVAFINALFAALNPTSKFMKIIAAGVGSIGITGALTALQTTLLAAAGGATVTYWTMLHEFQSIFTTSGLVMAFVAGIILLGIVFYFRNILPSIALHLSWNIGASTLSSWLMLIVH